MPHWPPAAAVTAPKQWICTVTCHDKLHLQDVDKARMRVVEQLSSIAAIKTVPASVKTQVLKFLAVHAFFAVSSTATGKVCCSSCPLAVV